MNNGTNLITYELYSDSGRTTTWYASGPAASAYTAANHNPVTFTVYGRAIQAQDVPAGAYSDSVAITVTYT